MHHSLCSQIANTKCGRRDEHWDKSKKGSVSEYEKGERRRVDTNPELGGGRELERVREQQQVAAQHQDLLLDASVQPQRVAHRAHER
jgi:hypothetical protein